MTTTIQGRARIRHASLQFPSLGWTTPEREELLWYVLNYVRSSRLKGDYAEFGVWRGDTFATAYHLKEYLDSDTQRLSDMRFHAFDSFEGFPELEGDDVFPQFEKGRRACSLERFKELLEEKEVPSEKVRIVRGWFSETLGEGREADGGIEDGSLAIAYVDCDLYKSTRDVMPFLGRKMMSGGVVVFDDWYCFAGHPGRGEQKACREFLASNPDVVMVPFRGLSWHGQTFIYHRLSPAELGDLHRMMF